jgi:trehalose-phosphatase
MNFHADSKELPVLLDHPGEFQKALHSSDFSLLGFDFDGTLAPIAENPDAVELPAETRGLLAELSECDRMSVLILSGRSLDDLKRNVRLDGIIYGGDHGFEIEFPNGGRYLPVNNIPSLKPDELNRHLSDRINSFSGVRVDVKKYSLTVHYRQADEKTAIALGEQLKEVLSGTDYSASPGRKCWEIRPRVNWNKGKAYQWVFHQKTTGLRLYIGDDSTDESVFSVMNDEDWSVVIPSAERDRKTQARFRLDSPSDIPILLERILEVCNK